MDLQSLETHLLLFVNHHTVNGLFDVLMPAFSQHGHLLIIPYIIAMLVWGSIRKNNQGKSYLPTALWTILIAVCAVFLAFWAEDTVKNAIMRTRPCRAIEEIRLIIACPKSFSMPSGHAITSFSAALPLFYLTREYIPLIWRFYPLLLASIVAFSRLYLGVHYPTDVLAGTILGCSIGWGLSALYQVIVSKIKKHI